MKLTTILSALAALALSGMPEAKAEVTPASQVVAAFAISQCAMEYGQSREMAYTIFEGATANLSDTVAMNVMSQPGFTSRVTNSIKESGGCKALTDMLHRRVTAELKRRGVDE